MFCFLLYSLLFLQPIKSTQVISLSEIIWFDTNIENIEIDRGFLFNCYYLIHHVLATFLKDHPNIMMHVLEIDWLAPIETNPPVACFTTNTDILLYFHANSGHPHKFCCAFRQSLCVQIVVVEEEEDSIT